MLESTQYHTTTVGYHHQRSQMLCGGRAKLEFREQLLRFPPRVAYELPSLICIARIAKKTLDFVRMATG